MTETRALGYIRLSDYRTNDASTSPERQREAITAYCTAKGWTLVHIEEDLDVSGSAVGLRLDRPGLVRVRERYDDVDVLIIPKVDRLARNVADFMTIAEDAEKHSVALVSVAESLDLSTPSGRFVAQILAAFAEMESGTIRARVLDGIRKARELGRFLGGVPPYGYTTADHPSGSGKTLVIEPDEAAVVTELAKRVLGGESVYSLTRDLNARGIASKTGKTWSVQAVRQVLTGTAVVGRRTHKGRVLTGDDGLPLEVFEPVLSLDTWNELRAVLEVDKPAAHRRTGPTPARLLSGLVRCGRCGAKMHPANSGGGKSYRCSTSARGRDCIGVSVRCDPLEAFIESEVLDRYGDREVLRLIETAPTEPAELVEVRAAIDTTASAMTDDDADVAALAERLATLKQRRRDLEAAPRQATSRIERTGRTLAETYAEAETIEEQRETIASKVLAVTVSPGRAGRRPFAPERIAVEWSEDVPPVEGLEYEFPVIAAT